MYFAKNKGDSFGTSLRIFLGWNSAAGAADLIGLIKR
jgi:hypothetical protein